MECHGERAGAARRRRERRLRSWWRHERMSIAMALATVEHHSFGPTAYDALRGQRTVTRAGEGEVREVHQALRGQKRLPPGMRPALLVEVQPQGRVERHLAEHMAELAPLVQILDAPVPQLGEQLVDIFNIFRLVDTQTPVEQVIEVPGISLPSRCYRTVLSAPQMAEQLVEVPTVVSFSSLQQLSVEQIIDIPVPRLGGRSVAQNVDTPVLHGRGTVVGRSLQDLRPEQSSTAVSEQTVSPAPRREGSRGGLQGFSPGQSSTQRMLEQNVGIPVPRTRARGGLRGSPPGQGLQRTVEQIIDIPVSRTRDDGGLPGAHLHQGSTARGGALGAQARLEAELEELLAISAGTGFTPQQQARFREVLSLLYGPG